MYANWQGNMFTQWFALSAVPCRTVLLLLCFLIVGFHASETKKSYQFLNSNVQNFLEGEENPKNGKKKKKKKNVTYSVSMAMAFLAAKSENRQL